MMRRVLSIAATIALAAGVGALPPMQAQAVGQPDGILSDIGNEAVRDLRECLSSNPAGALDIYYLIDASGSLETTDPNVERADILQNSLVQLAELAERFTVRYAAGFFGNGFVESLGWTEVSSEETGQKLFETIEGQAKESLGWTNWERGINGAQSALEAQKQKSGGCQMLIWLTDGGMNLAGDTVATATAINTLCGAPVASGGAAPARGLGQFNALRKANVSVFGTLLSVTDSLDDADRRNIPFMQPMVEGRSPKTDVVCGEKSVPEGYSNGAYIEATDTTQLSRVFLGLGQSIAGGKQAGIDENGKFQIDPGVAGFSVVSQASGTWSLTPPGSPTPIVSNDDDIVDPRVSVTRSAGALLIDWPTTGPAPDSGQWTFVSSDPRPQLFRFSGLSIELDPLPPIVATKAATITGSISGDSSEPLDLENYDYTLTLSKRVAGAAEQTEIATIDADSTSGAFSYEYTDEGPEGNYDIIASITGLTTTASKLPLEDLSTLLPVTIEVLPQFPTITRQPEMTELAGSSGESTGSFTIEGPAKEGAIGTACFADELQEPTDSPKSDRDRWTTSVTVTGNVDKVDGCIDVDHGQTVIVDIAMSNTTPANSTVRATLPVSLESAQGTKLVQNVDITANSTQQVNATVLWSVLILLILLGLLIPLGLLYAVNYVSAKIGYGAKLQRASFPVTVAPDGTITSRSGMNLRGSDVGTDDFKFQPPKPDARTFTDAQLGTLTATSPRNPFGDLIYAISPAAGRLVFTQGKTGNQSSRLAFRTARKATFAGHMSTLAALTVSEADHVAKGAREPINGILVVYSTSPPSGQSGYSARMAEALGASKLRPVMANAREAIRAEQKTQPSKVDAAAEAPPREAGSPGAAAAGQLAPPPPKKRSGASAKPPAAPPGRESTARTHSGPEPQAPRPQASRPPRSDREPPPPRPPRRD
jgi:hypothetical protein